MDKNILNEYLNQLKEFEEKINGEDNLDDNFMGEIDNLLVKISREMEKNVVPPTSPDLSAFQNSFKQNKDVLIKVKKLDPNAVIPTYSKVGDAGMDLTITNIKENTSFGISYGFGIAMEIPKGYVGLIFPRSSVRNQDLILSNCVGVIDSGYRGELQATFKKTNGLDSISYNVGDRGAQIIILPYPQVYMTEVPELSDSERGTGGFGSTGK